MRTNDITTAKREFVISAKRGAGAVALQMFSGGGNKLVQDLKTYSGVDIDIVRAIRPRRSNVLNTASTSDAASDALLVRMPIEEGRQLQAQSTSASSAVWIEENLLLDHLAERLDLIHITPQYIGLFDPATSVQVTLRVLGEGDKPLTGAVVTIHGFGLPISTSTDAAGNASFLLPPSQLASVPAIVIEPASMHWSKVLRGVSLQQPIVNTVRVTGFAEFNPRFQSGDPISWGIEQLGLSRRDELTGKGVKVGIIDSGCDVTHPLLSHISRGADFNPGASPVSWRTDDIGHGTHVAGVIGARSTDANWPIRGICPEAEIHIYKVFPSGTFFTLAEAIDQAIEDGVDVINLSLGSAETSSFLVERFEKAYQAGIACVVAAGNSGDGVKFPANLSSAIAISAIGSRQSIPSDSISATTVLQQLQDQQGYFAASFSCFGTAVDFAGPGVGIISTFPNGGYKALDGTSMAAPHVTGLSAILLAHDPALSSIGRQAARVEALVTRLRQSARNLPFGPDRVGGGLAVYGAPNPVNGQSPTPTFNGLFSFVETPSGLRVVLQ